MKTYSLARAITVAVLILAASVLVRWATPDYLSAETARRGMGVLMGLIVVVYANAIPKHLVSLAKLRCSAAREQAARRFAAWSLVLGGLTYSVAALVAPAESIHLIGGIALAVALAVAVFRCVRRDTAVST